MSRAALLLAVVSVVSACLAPRPPWLGNEYALVHGGTIYPAADAAPVEALLIVDGRVLGLGARAELEARIEDMRGRALGWKRKLEVRRIDIRGGTAVPGLVDAHGHLESLGESLEIVDLLGCRDLAELVKRVAARAGEQPAGTWIQGRGWDQTLFPDQAFPQHAALSAAVPDHPVFLERVDGHAAFANARALESAGLTGTLPEIEGGRIVLDASGKPTGVLVDAAATRVFACIPKPDAATRTRRILLAQERLLSLGLVGMHDMGTAPETLAVLRELAGDGRLNLRVASYLWANEGLAGFEPYLVTARQQNSVCANCATVGIHVDARHKLRVIGAKLMVDGALGSRGAALLEPYSDAPGETGLVQLDPELYRARLQEVLAQGLQPATHAIGDWGNRMVLDAYGEALAKDPRVGTLRPRLEHAQIVAEADWARFEALGVLPSMQPTHATSDMRWAEARVGPERIPGAYAWRRLPTERVPLALGSDFPVESPNPLPGLYAARTRQDARGEPAGGWLPDQRLDPVSALAGFSSGAAFAAHEETLRGKLLVGYAADLSVFSVDPLRCEPRELLEAHTLATIVDGELVYSVLSSN